jgi:glyoxylase-like metal-dependent hydrolase (beta-lactamase superfamily II)
MTQYMHSLAKLLPRQDRLYYPTHGAPIAAPQAYVEQLIAHRLEREQQVLACLAAGTGSIEAMVAKLYAGIDPRLHRAAARSVLAHLKKLVEEGRASCDGVPHGGSLFHLAPGAP